MGWLGRQPTRRCVESNCLEDTNCHPFNFENWLFQHNGSVPEFSKLKRQLMFDVEPKLFPFIEGSTDSETLFFLALTFGLRDDPPATLARTMGHVEHAREQAGIEQPIFFRLHDRRQAVVGRAILQQQRVPDAVPQLSHSRLARHRRDLRTASASDGYRIVGALG